jgi:hypothetical protein
MQAGAHTTEVLKQLLPSLAQSEVMPRCLPQKCALFLMQLPSGAGITFEASVGIGR